MSPSVPLSQEAVCRPLWPPGEALSQRLIPTQQPFEAFCVPRQAARADAKVTPPRGH